MEPLLDVVSWFADAANWRGPGGMPARLAEHVGYSLGATLLAAAIALPPALWVGHTGRGVQFAMQLANVGRAAPSLGIIIGAFILFGFGLTPVVIALVALAIPPIVTNTAIGIGQVDPEAREAAEGMGMTGRQLLWRVELPLALPLVMAGIRTSAVQVVATATLAAYVGMGGLGRYIIDGLAQGAQYNRDARAMAMAGGVAVALLALLTEAGLAIFERRVTPPGVRPPPDLPRGARIGGA